MTRRGRAGARRRPASITRRARLVWLSVAVAAVLASASACSGAGSGGDRLAGATPQVTLRLGYFPNVTHATALVGVSTGIFADKLGPSVTLRTKTFNSGPPTIEALFAGALDAAYIGPNPAINGFVKSKGAALRIVAGATSGGVSLVVRPTINSPSDLRGKKVASPQLGGTQDVALRAWLKAQGLKADTSGGGDVSVVPQENAQTLDAFKSGTIDGAWVPEPWGSRLVLEGGGKVLVHEADLWPDGRYVTTQLIVAKRFLEQHPDVVKRLIEGHVSATKLVNADPAAAQRAANDEIERITQKRVKAEVMAAAFKNLSFTNDPIAPSLRRSAENAHAVGLADEVDLTGIYDLRLLNEVLAADGEAPIPA